ncbi:MAG TPA: 30S ribosomal protein S21 [Patescibacteria group bacterium]|nr:30S ribosomal protein S21 [Patescibacteria group bacterium]
MIVIIKKKGESKDTFFRKFSRMFKGEDIIYEVNKKLFFKKPSLLKKEKMKERMKRRAQQRKRFL